VIKLNETRVVDAPTLESVREELELQVRQTTVQQTIERVTEEANVDRSGAAKIDPAFLQNIEWLE
jgi:peptidyl-prolyl cis-trans isomerase C